ncbi:hypothetical protein D3C76_1624480 [compost metagenome]
MQVAYDRHIQNGHHHSLLLAGQWRAGQGNRQWLARGGSQQSIVHPVSVSAEIGAVKGRISPVGYRRRLDEAQEIDTLQLLHSGSEQT